MRLLPGLLVLAVGCGDPSPGPTGGGSFINPGTNTSPSELRAVELSGGTLAIAASGRFAAVSDPEHDRLWIVDLTNSSVKGRIQFPPGSAPQRVIEDGAGKLRVALRGTGKVATVSPSQAVVTATVEACPEVRGLTWNKATSSLLVACAGGELVTLKDATRTVATPAGDLRDVILAGGKTWVSTFRSARLLELDGAAAVAGEVKLPAIDLVKIDGKQTSFVPAVAWRTIATPGGKIVTLHQRAVVGDIAAIQVPSAPAAPAYYQNLCNSSIVRTTVTVVDNGAIAGSIDLSGVLPVDVAVSPDNTELAIAQPGSGFVQRFQLAAALNGISGGICAPGNREIARVGEVTGVAFTPQNDLIVHTRNPLAVWILGKTGGERTQQQILLSGDQVKSAGHDLFHAAAGAIACASCHPEGGDDGHVWTLFKQQVRTQSLAGGIVETAPFHWNGSLSGVKDVVTETFVGRMGAAEPNADVVTGLSSWMARIPRLKIQPRASVETIEAGKTAFTEAGCGSCHWGPLFTNNASMDVGTGGVFQVPSLRGLSLRGPWMHDGCAKTLEDRFGPCGGTRHGNTAALAPEQLSALVAYLQTL